ncbi:MAG: hypothetical protein M3Z70_08525 [Bartonella sp.]|nr:hypothetical protein [Bartonella sp.]
MTAGLKIYNDAGILQIDDTYQNLVVVLSGTIRTDQAGEASLWLDWNGPLLVATSSPNGSCCAVRDRQGTKWHYDVGSDIPNDEVKWYAFSNPQNIPFQGGLRVYRADGSIAFDSNQRPLVMAYFFSIDAPLLPRSEDLEIGKLPKKKNVEQPQDIYVPLQQGRTYTAFPIAFQGAVSIVYRTEYRSGWKSQYEHYCYLPQTRNGGVNFKARLESVGGREPYIPAFYVPRSSSYNRVQSYWIIDITGF